MSKEPTKRSLSMPFILGISLGITAKLVDVPELISDFPILDDIMLRFGIWVWTASLIAVRSKSPLFAAARSFAFFAGMLLAYYGYTVLVLKFFPKSQMILWGSIALVTPFCGFVIWQVHKNKWFANLIAALPFILFFTEWYMTAREDRLLLVYLCMTGSWFVAIPENRRRLSGLLCGLLISMIVIGLMQMGIIRNIFDLLLNI